MQGALFSATQQLEAEIDDEAGEHLKQSDFSHLVGGDSMLALLNFCQGARDCVAGHSLWHSALCISSISGLLQVMSPLKIYNHAAVALGQITH